MEYFSHVDPNSVEALMPSIQRIRVPSIEAIDQAASPAERRQLLAARLQGENNAHFVSRHHYALTGIYLHDCPSVTDNLLEADLAQRVPITCQLFAFSDQTYVGYVDLTVHCLGISRHDAEHDVHRSINRHNCFDIKLQVLTFEPHFVADYQYPEDFIHFLKAADEYTIVYSPDVASSRLTCSGAFHNFVSPLLAPFDGLVPPGILNTCKQSATTLDISQLIGKLL